MMDESRIRNLRYQVSEKMPLSYSDLLLLLDLANAQAAEIERLREHLISALDTLKDAEVCDDNCDPCNEARAELEQSK
jgi:hypothetical protein